MYQDLGKQKEEDDKKKNPDKYKEKRKDTSMYRPDGEMRQCNEGGYKFLLEDSIDPEFSTFSLNLPKFLDTSLLEVNLFPFFVSVRVKGKLTQVKMWEEVLVEGSEIKRSSTTGELLIKMRKVKPNYPLASYLQREEEQKREAEEKDKNKKDENLAKATQPAPYTQTAKREKKEHFDVGKRVEAGYEDLPDLE